MPDFYIFNPTCDYAVANGSHSWHPNKLLKKMERDLDTMQLFISQSEDFVIVNKIPSREFITSLQKLDIEIPKFVLHEEITDRSKFSDLPKNGLLPWGWSPEIHKRLQPLKMGCSVQFKESPVFKWQAEHRELYSKKFAAGILESLISEYSNECFVPPDKTPEICTTKQEFKNLIKRWGKIMVKAPWSSSGRGLQPITKTPVHPKVWEKVLGVVNEQGYAIVEPYFDKALDLAFQFELKKGKAGYLGISNFTTDHKGQYIGNSLNGLPAETDKKILGFAATMPQKIVGPLIEIIERSKMSKFYEGFFGVDTLIYFNEKKQLKINPCLEINVRQSMGLLTLQIEKIIAPGRKGIFRIFYKPGANFHEFAKNMQGKYPIKIIKGKIELGFFPLTEPKETALFGAYVLVF